MAGPAMLFTGGPAGSPAKRDELAGRRLRPGRARAAGGGPRGVLPGAAARPREIPAAEPAAAAMTRAARPRPSRT